LGWFGSNQVHDRRVHRSVIMGLKSQNDMKDDNQSSDGFKSDD